MSNNFFENIKSSDYPYFIADIGANHNGELSLAKKMINELNDIGCDAAKFQSWTKHSLFSKGFYNENSQFVDKEFGTLEEMVEKFSLSKNDHTVLNDYCQGLNISFCSSAFSYEEADMLEEFGVPFFKIASMDLNNIPLLDYIAKKNKPIILSTGMGTMTEIDNAVNSIYSQNNTEIILLHCVSIYPPEDKIVNLKNIKLLIDTFNLPVGFSDHTIGTSLTLAAISLGAKVIEKHYTFDKTYPGWDHEVSANKTEMIKLINDGRRIIDAMGSRERILSNTEMEQRKSFRRSIVAKKSMKKGDKIDQGCLDFKRPGTGIRPDEVESLFGLKLKRDIDFDELIKWSDVE